MKIAYLLHWNEGPRSGVFKKIVDQISEWSRLGHRIALFLFTSGTGEDWNRALGGVEVNVQRYGGGISRLMDFGRLAGQVREWNPDVIYHRYDLYYFGLPRLLRTIPSVLEINSNDLTEMRMERNRLRYHYHRLTRARVLKAAAGTVFVSRELSEEPAFSRYTGHHVVIGNGINLDEFLVRRNLGPSLTLAEIQSAQEREDEASLLQSTCHPEVDSVEQHILLSTAPATSSPAYSSFNLSDPDAGDNAVSFTAPSETAVATLAKLQPDGSLSRAVLQEMGRELPPAALDQQPATARLVFIGSSGQPWHGIDAIAELAKLRPGWEFDIIGLHAAELQGPVPANLKFHGPMSREEYQPLLDQADVAIGTMALYRKQMNEASPLKVREYLANGLPVITAYAETDFPRPVPFILQLPGKSGNMVSGLGEIDAFVRQWRGTRVPRKEIAHLDTRVKESERLKYMKLIMREKGERP